MNDETAFSLYRSRFRGCWTQHESSLQYPEQIRGIGRTHLYCSGQIFDVMEACNVPVVLHAFALER